MNCVICKNGETKPGRAKVTLHRGSATVLIKNVPADICNNCGEYYLSEEITDRTLKLAEGAVKHGAELEVLRFAA